MAQRKRKSIPQASKPRTPKEEAAQTPPNGIFVQVTATEEGQSLSASPLGDVKFTEIPTLLRVAANNVEKQLGI